MTALLERFTKLSVLEIEGTLRAPGTGELRQRVQALLNRGERRILLDLARLSGIDAAGVGELVRAYRTTNAAGGVLRIAHASRRVRHLLQVAGLLKLLSAGVEAWPDETGHPVAGCSSRTRSPSTSDRVQLRHWRTISECAV